MSLDKFVAWPTLHGLPHHPREGADSQYILVLDLPVECQPGDPPGAGEIIDLNAGISPGISRIVFSSPQGRLGVVARLLVSLFPYPMSAPFQIPKGIWYFRAVDTSRRSG